MIKEYVLEYEDMDVLYFYMDNENYVVDRISKNND